MVLPMLEKKAMKMTARDILEFWRWGVVFAFAFERLGREAPQKFGTITIYYLSLMWS